MEYKCILDSEPHHQLNTIKDKRMSWKIQSKNIIIFNPKIEHLNRKFTAINISRSPLD